MASLNHRDDGAAFQPRAHVCSIIPPKILQHILNNSETSAPTRAAAQKTYNHVCKLQANRVKKDLPHGVPPHGLRTSGIVPPQIFQAMRQSEDTSSEQKERAEHNLLHSQKIHSARTGTDEGAASTKEHLYRALYDSQKTDKVNKTLLFEEGADKAKIAVDQNASEVYDFFGKTYEFYFEVFKRNSVDNKGLHLIGSVHYDDDGKPPGMDNAFWDGKEMAFGDGDGDIFGSFTKNLDVIGHELTHGVTQYTAELEYEYQAGALNESVSDVFGSMIKQYFGGKNGKTKVKSADADWLIGEGIFLPSVKNAAALRSMKAPGTAYDNPAIGKDPQAPDMDGYEDSPNTADGDWGGVHTNSGIPNHAFYLASVALGGHSWEKAGKIWYAALTDKSLKGIDTKTAFKTFADLTVKYAASLFGTEEEAIIKKAWTDVKVYKATTPKSEL